MRKRIRSLILVLTILAFLFAMTIASEARNLAPAFNDEYLILFDTQGQANLNARRKAPALDELKDGILAGMPAEFSVTHRLSHLPMAVLQTRNPRVMNALQRHPKILAIYPNRRIFPFLAESLPLIRQLVPSAAGYGGQGTTMAIVDTGINYLNRSEFGNCVGLADPDSCRVVDAVDIATDDGSLDDNGHGTHVGAIAAVVASEADLVAIDVFDGAASSDALVLGGINWAISHQADYNIVTINLSLGDGSYNTAPCKNRLTNPYVTAVANARAAGILVVAAAGNEGYSDALSRPACTPDVTSVGAVYDANVGGIGYSICTDATTAADQIACFSNSADFMSLWAPGAMITAAGATKAGTSQAAPHVAGVLAVLRSAYPAETLIETDNRLLSATTLVTDPRNGATLPRLDMEEVLDIPAPVAVPGMGSEATLLLAALLGIFCRGGFKP